MSVETFTPNESVISLTEAAIRHFEGKLKNHPNKIIRLSTKVSGCTGYAYVLDFADGAETEDTQISISDALTLAVDAKAVDLLRNTEIDFVQEGVNGVVKFNNPNVVDECGCGESFNVG